MGGNLQGAVYGAMAGAAGGWLGFAGYDPLISRSVEAAINGTISSVRGNGFARGARPYAMMYLFGEMLDFATPDIETYDVKDYNPERPVVAPVSEIQRSGAAFINGMKNTLDEARYNASRIVGQTDFTLAFNPSRSFLQDGIEPLQDLIGNGSKASRQLRALLTNAADRGLTVELFAHSQGGAIAASVMSSGAISGVTLNFVGAPIAESVARGLPGFRSWQANSLDAVPMIFGRNGNLFQMAGALLSLPRLFMSCPHSPHSACAYGAN